MFQKVLKILFKSNVKLVAFFIFKNIYKRIILMNEINNIFKWYNKFDKIDVLIETENHSFEITLLNR